MNNLEENDFLLRRELEKFMNNFEDYPKEIQVLGLFCVNHICDTLDLGLHYDLNKKDNF